jgi:hypothetical protein
MRIILLLSVVCAAFILSNCGQPPRAVTADDFQILRSYGWDSTVDEPMATWNPESYQVLARSAGGFVLLEEGSGKQQYFASQTKHDTAFPAWVNGYQFVFGPRHNVQKLSDGQVVATNEGLYVVTVYKSLSGKALPDAPNELTKYGYRPRMWGDKIVFASEERIFVSDSYGKMEEFGLGFMPEPQRRGYGITWQERPVIEKDYWSGAEVKRGNLYIRWKKGTTTTLANAVEARWTHNGGVLATVLRQDPLPGQPWWSGGTDVYFVANAKSLPVLVASDARSADPHPNLPVCAVVGATGAIHVCAYDGSFRRQIADKGERPQWSYDGRRLMSEEKIEGNDKIRYLRIVVFKYFSLTDATGKTDKK